MKKKDKTRILLIGPLPPPIGGVSIHIKRLSSLIADEFDIDYIDESHSIKDEYFNLRTFRLSHYLKKVIKADILYIHSGKRRLVIFHIIVGRFFFKKIIITVHGFPESSNKMQKLADSFFYSQANRIIAVNPVILENLKMPLHKAIVKYAFLPPAMDVEPDLPEHLSSWLKMMKKKRQIVISANAYQLKYFNSQDLYGLDMCIETATRLIKKGLNVCFVYNVSSLEKNRDLFENYQKIIAEGGFADRFLLLNEELSFVRLITYSDIILRPTNTDGDALTIREALYLGKPVIASDVISRPEETILFRNRDNDDLEKKIEETIRLGIKIKSNAESELKKDYQSFYIGLIGSVINPESTSSYSKFKDRSKVLTEKIPPEAGVLLNYLPFGLRLGPKYNKHYLRANELLMADLASRNEYIISRFSNIFSHFRQNSSFYDRYLDESGCNIARITSLDDIAALPLITKALLRKIPVENRTIMKHSFKKFNTGGTSGSTLSFYVEKPFYPREWSHIHYMWGKIGYKPSMTKITIRGKNINDIYEYRFNQNEFLINSYYSFRDEDYHRLLNVFKKFNTEFIHGYPSAIYYFLKEVSINAPYLLEFLQKNIKGILFGSEYPSPHFRDFIENLLTKNTISWYGHTEGVILAAELYQKYEYVPFLSYGFTEAVKTDNHYHLVGTSFDNLATPFIRYDTEDLINPKFDEYGNLESFKITGGRLGEFVQDKNNKNISLTALIFGRHHKLFDKVNFIQVKQTIPGQIIVYYSNSIPIANPSDLFDSTNLNIDVLFEQTKEPYKTIFGKIPLLIK